MNHRNKLKPYQIEKIPFYRYKCKYTLKMIGDKFNVSNKTIWYHLQSPEWRRWFNKRGYILFGKQLKRTDKKYVSLKNALYRKRHPEIVKKNNDKWNKYQTNQNLRQVN